MTQRLAAAASLAEELHRGQVRKGTSIPYISHLYAVAALIMEWGGDEEVAIAGLLHDAVEDCGGLPVAQRIRAELGDRVADTVLACSDSLHEDAGAKASWAERKTAHLQSLRKLTPDAILVTLADKTHNLRCLVRDLKREGPATMSRFKEPERVFWYYNEVEKTLRALAPTAAAKEMSAALAEFDMALVGRPELGKALG